MPPTKQTECAGYLMLREKLYWEDKSLHRAACHGEPDRKIKRKHYCLMHAPATDKAEEFRIVLEEKLAVKDYNFRGTWFPDEVDFSRHSFESEVNFNWAVFNEHVMFSRAKFNGEANFRESRFSGVADFGEAQFNGGDAYFYAANFSEYANFSGAQFSKGKTDFNGAQFSSDAYFTEAKFSGGNAYFDSAQFSGGIAWFHKAQFSGGTAWFSKAQFSGGNADFNSAQFSGGNAFFSHAKFSGGDAGFREAQFSKSAHFEETVFSKNVDFANAVFERQAFFDRAEFQEKVLTDFCLARFMDFTRFMDLKLAEGAEFYFGEATFEKPERVHFHSIKNLCPRWFINIDTRKFNFESVEFPLLNRRASAEIFELLKLGALIKIFHPEAKTEKELKAAEDVLKQLEEKEFDGDNSVQVKEPPHKLLITAYRRLAANAEENNRYEEAMGFRYLAMETQRRSAWWRRFLPVTLHWWYWASSGYGERAWRAAMMLALVWLVPFLFYVSPAAVFTRVETKRDAEIRGAAEYHESADVPGMPPGEAVLYGLNTMAFQKPEPRAAKTSPLTQWVIFAQTILGPLQAALLALAIRRKFMR